MAGYRRKDGRLLAADETVVTVELKGFEYCKLPTLARTLDISANQVREVLADTTKKYKLSEKLNAFLDMIRHLVQRAVAMLKLGKAINKVLADKEASAKLDPEKFEEGKWWEYAFSALYGPLASIPGMGELVEALGTLVFFNLPGHVFDIEELQKARTRASVGRALIDVQGFVRAWRKIYGFLTDDEEHSLAEYTRAASTISRTTAIATGWMGNMVGFWSTAVAVLMNPIDFGARVWRNMKQYWD